MPAPDDWPVLVSVPAATTCTTIVFATVVDGFGNDTVVSETFSVPNRATFHGSPDATQPVKPMIRAIW